MSGIVYYIFNIESGKGYVGKTVLLLNIRVGSHLKNDSYIGNALRKYGLEHFKVVVIDSGHSDKELYDKEILWIDILDTLAPNGYNLSCGGEGTSGYKLEEETRKAMSYAQKGKKVSDRLRQMASITHKGKIVSEETRIKMSISGKGKHGGKRPPMTNEQKKKLSVALTGKPWTENRIKAWTRGLS